jgi:ATP-dependent DNA helicase PIF1
MLDCITFEWADKILQQLRSSGKPFGGIQLLLVGDFFQLPPINKTGTTKYLFESRVFWESMQCMWELKEIRRQSDPIFCGILNRMRFAENTEEDFAILQSRVSANLLCSDSIEPTKLFSRNINVDKINGEKLLKLTTASQHFSCIQGFHELRATTIATKSGSGKKIKSPPSVKLSSQSNQSSQSNTFSFAETAPQKLLKDINLPEQQPLKIGAQVMLSFNLDFDAGFVNGTRGVIVDFKESDKGKSLSDNDVATLFHKRYSQEELSNGMGRMVYPKGKLPVVEFSNGKKFLMPYVKWTRTLAGSGEAYVWHIPLRLAWAATMHRVQGQTLSHLEIALDKSVFEVGQAFVAVSRAESLEGLCFSSFDPTCIKANEKVKQFYKTPFEFQKLQAMMPDSEEEKAEVERFFLPSTEKHPKRTKLIE